MTNLPERAMQYSTHDCHGLPVAVGDEVKILDIDPDRARERLRLHPAMRRGLARARRQRSGEGD